MRISVVAMTLVVMAAPAASAQEKGTLTFGVEVEMVNLTVAVVDSKGKYVSDVPCEKFAVRENGDAQKIELCEKQELPIDLVLLVDASRSMQQLAPVAKDAAVKFIRSLRPQDRAKVALFGERQRTVQDFTNDPVVLEKAIRELVFDDGATALYLGLYVTLRELEKEGKPSERRKVIILLTDGEDTASLIDDDRAIEEASRHSSVVYPILIRPAKGLLNDWGKDNTARSFAARVAGATGGTAYVAAEAWALKNAYALIADELKVQYRLGYYPTHAKDPGPQRTISVMVAHGNVTLRHRQSYWIPKGRKTR